MGIIVRFKDYKKKKITDTLWDIILCRKNCEENVKLDAEYIFNQIIKSFNDAGIPMKNCKAFCSDTCNLMMGEHNSVASRFIEKFPHIRIEKCRCHIEHLAARKALKEAFPEIISSLPSEIHNYLGKSGRRTHSINVLNKKLGQKKLRIKKQSHTRWLSYYECLRTILRRWTIIKIQFESEVDYYDENNQTVAQNPKEYSEIFNDQMMHAKFIFLESALAKLVIVNKKLQAEAPILLETPDDSITVLYKELLATYIKKEHLNSTQISDIDPENVEEFKPLRDVYIGKQTLLFLRENFPNAFINNSTGTHTELNENIDHFYGQCRKFYQVACKILKEKCDMSKQDKRWIFHKKNIFNSKIREKYENLEEIFDEFKIFDNSVEEQQLKNAINTEWNSLLTYKFPDDFKIKLDKTADIDKYWFLLLEFQDDEGVKPFEELADFVLTTFCIPNANAAPERLWSRLNHVKTKERSRISFEVLKAVLMTRYQSPDI